MYIEVNQEFYDQFGSFLEDAVELEFKTNSKGNLVADVSESQAESVIQVLDEDDKNYSAEISTKNGYAQILGTVTVGESEYEFEWKN